MTTPPRGTTTPTRPQRPPLRQTTSEYETPVRRGGSARPTRSGTSKKKVNQVSQASLALLSPAHAMGIHLEESWSQDTTQSLPEDLSPMASNQQDSFYGLTAGTHDDATPELEAFAVEDLQTALTKSSRQSMDDDDDDDVADDIAWDSRHRRGPTLASVFEDDGDMASPRPSSGRRVAFRVRGASEDTTPREMHPPSHGKSGHSKSLSTQSSSSTSSSSPFARFFSWKKNGGKKSGHQAVFGDIFDSQPSSAPPHITTFDRSMPPPMDYDSVSDATSACGSLPATPMGGAVVPLPMSVGTPTKVMPHRKGGPPPRSILRKQSAPALRAERLIEEQAPPMPTRSFEEPPSLPSSSSSRQLSPRSGGLRQQPPAPLFSPSGMNTSPSGSSFTERRYSTVGRGVARCRNTSDASMSASSASTTSLASSTKSPTKRSKGSVNRRFEGMPTSPSVNPLVLQGSALSPTSVRSPPGALFSLPEQKMASQVANGLMNNARGFEEPMPRSAAARGASTGGVVVPLTKTLRRRSRSVGALDGAAMVSAAALAPRPVPSVSEGQQTGRLVGLGRGRPQQPPPIHCHQLGRLAGRDITPTQQSPGVFAGAQATFVGETRPLSPSRHCHKSGDSLDSVSSDEDLGEAAVVTTVQARRVQLVNTRAKATAVASPNLCRSPRSPVPQVSVQPPSSPSILAGSPSISLATSSHESALAKPAVLSPPRLLTAELDEETLRKRWSKRDSCILALSLANLDLPDEEEDCGYVTHIAPVGGINGLGFQTTAPLNIKPRHRVKSDVSESNESASEVSPATSASEISSVDGDAFPYSVSNKSTLSTRADSQQAPAIYTFGPSDSYGTGTMGSLPSLDSSSGSSVTLTHDAVEALPTLVAERSTTPTPGGLMVLPHSSSMTSIATVSTGIFDYGMTPDQAAHYSKGAQQIVGRGMSLEAGVYDGYEEGVPGDDATTPTMSNGPFGTLPPQPAAIIVGHHHTQDSLSMGAVQQAPTNILAEGLPNAGHYGLKLSPLDSRRNSSSQSSIGGHTVRCPSPISVRSITPTQESQQQVTSLGLGLDLGCVKVAEAGLTSPSVGIHKHCSAEIGAGHWEDQLRQFQSGGAAAFLPSHQATRDYYSTQYSVEHHDDAASEWEMGVAL